MDDLITQNLKQQYDNLPVELRNAISSADLPRKFEAITKDNKLMIDQGGKVQMETLLVLLGLEPLENYVDNLAKNIPLTKEQATAVAADANELIFKNIRETLQKVNEEDKAAEEAENIKTNPTNQPAATQTAPVAEKPLETENDLLPEIAPVAGLPSNSIFTPKTEPYHENISPVENIVQTKMTEPVVVPKETIVVQEQSKLPEKNKPSDSTDPYREPVI